MITRAVASVIDRYSQPLGADAYRSLLNPLWTREIRGVVSGIRPLTPTATAITITTNRAWRQHQPGQYVTVGVEIDGVRHHRCYSLTSSPSAEKGAGKDGGKDARSIEIAVQRVEGGLVSTHLTTAARTGDLVYLSAPAGDFVLPEFTPDRLLLVSGGSGITPIIGMLRSLAARPPHTDVTLIHHAPTAERTMFAIELSLLAATHEWLTVHIVHTQDGGDRLDAARLDDLCPDWRDRETYVCGPAPLISFVTDHWADEHTLERLHLERFTLDLPAMDPSTAPAGTVTASFGKSNVVTPASTATTLLETAEAAGVIAPFGCRTGVCHTCSTRLVSGCTTDIRDGRVSEPGTHVQLCISRPVGDVALDL